MAHDDGPLVGTHWREKDPYRDTRVIEIVGRCQPRETFATPVVWEARVVTNPIAPASVGRTTYVSDKSLTRKYTQEPRP